MKKKNRMNSLFLCVIILLMTQFNNAQAQLAEGQTKFLGNLQYKGEVPMSFDMYWNQITPENSGKWASCEQARDDFNYWSWLDVAYNQAKINGYPFKQHTMVWGHSSGEPEWMSSVPQSEQMAEVEEWFEAFAERYPDVDMMDVVNEPLHDPPSYAQALGGSGTTGWDWVVWSYEKAREMFPNTTLILNEYNILNYENECDAFLEIVEVLQTRGLIDAIGCESHSLENISFSTIQTNLEKLAATGLDIYISELELRGDDQRQLELFQQLFPYFYEHPAVKGVTLWGYVEGEMWRNEAHLIKADGTERPAMQWLKEYFDYTPPTEFSVTTSTTGLGSVSLTPAGGVYAPGTEVTITATADTDYEFSYWSGSINSSDNPLTIEVTNNMSFTANFEEGGSEPGQFTLDVNTVGNGSVSLSPAGGSYDEGTVVTLTANPGDGGEFTGWSGALSGTANPETITMTSDVSVTATFEAGEPVGDCDNPVTASLPFEQNGVGTQCYFTNGDIEYINSWNMDVVEVNGVDFTNNWSDNMPARQDGGYYIYYQASVGWAHLEVDGSEGGGPEYYTLTTNTTGAGNISVSPDESSYQSGTLVTLTATPGTGYIFNGWSGDLSGSENPASIAMDGDKAVTAIFEAEEPGQYTLTVNVSGAGDVTLSPAGGLYDAGTVVSLTASADAENIFTGWSGDLSGSANPTSITMNSNVIVTASFEESGSGEGCDNPVNITGPFTQNGAGNYCWFTDSEPGYVNSWNLDVLTINGADFTNAWGNSFPAPVDGGYYIYYEGSFGWSHFEMSAPKNAGFSQHIANETLSIDVHPNPSYSGAFNIFLSEQSNAAVIRLSDMSGKIIHELDTKGADFIELNLQLDAGIYLISVTDGNQISTETLIVQ